jgi:hypothetical protein
VQVTNFPPNTSVTCELFNSSATPKQTDGNGQAYFDWGWYSGTPEQGQATCRAGNVTASG